MTSDDPYLTQINGRWLIHRHPTRPRADLTAGYPTNTLGVLADHATQKHAEEHYLHIIECRQQLRNQRTA